LATEITVPEVVELVLAPASTSVDGMTVSEHSPLIVLEVKQKLDRLNALAATNGNGGKVGGWGGAIKERYKYGGIE
jgi:hypothetical protein